MSDKNINSIVYNEWDSIIEYMNYNGIRDTFDIIQTICHKDSKKINIFKDAILNSVIIKLKEIPEKEIMNNFIELRFKNKSKEVKNIALMLLDKEVGYEYFAHKYLIDKLEAIKNTFNNQFDVLIECIK